MRGGQPSTLCHLDPDFLGIGHTLSGEHGDLSPCSVCLLLPARPFFHCSDLHTSPGGRAADHISMVTGEVQSADLGLESETVGDRYSLPPPGARCSVCNRNVRPCRGGDVELHA